MTAARARPPAGPRHPGAALLDRYLRLSDGLSWLAETLAVALIYAFCALMLAEVFARGFLRSSLAFSWEWSAFAMAGVFLLGAGPALRRGVHVRVTLLHGLLPGRGQHWLNVVATGMAIVLVLLLLQSFWAMFQQSWARGLRQSSYTATPLVWPQGLALLGIVQLLLDLVARLLRLLRGEPPEQPLPPAGGEL